VTSGASPVSNRPTPQSFFRAAPKLMRTAGPAPPSCYRRSSRRPPPRTSTTRRRPPWRGKLGAGPASGTGAASGTGRRRGGVRASSGWGRHRGQGGVEVALVTGWRRRPGELGTAGRGRRRGQGGVQVASGTGGVEVRANSGRGQGGVDEGVDVASGTGPRRSGILDRPPAAGACRRATACGRGAGGRGALVPHELLPTCSRMRTTSRRSAAAAPTCWRTLRATVTLLVGADEGVDNPPSPTPPPPELDELWPWCSAVAHAA
jgi:hypothetical protein